jgi:hypothetical protein
VPLLRAGAARRRERIAMDQSEIKVDVLLEPSSEPIGSLEGLHDRCLAGLTARIWETCCWPDAPGRSTIGDYRFSIVEFEPAPDVPLYVQLWSEPQEPVLIEVSSGNRNPAALKYVWRAQRKLLEQRGFTVGGATRNFQKEAVVDSPESAEALASETLAIFFDIFGYRAEQPLTMTLHLGSRSEQRSVHVSITPEDFVKIAERHGFRASLITGDSDVPIVALEKGSFKTVALFGSLIQRDNLFGSLLLRTRVRGSSSLPLPNPANNDVGCPVRFTVDGDGSVLAETSLIFDGGVTTEWIGKTLHRWRRTVRTHQHAMKHALKRSLSRAETIKSRVSIH